MYEKENTPVAKRTKVFAAHRHRAMADPEVRISGGAADASGDVEMQGGDSADVLEVGETGADDAPGEEAAEDETAMDTERPAARTTFVE